MDRRTSERAQASVELVALLPLLAVLALGVWQAALAGHAAWASGAAARAAARAAAVEGDAAAGPAARRALPRSLRAGARVAVAGDGAVRVSRAGPARRPRGPVPGAGRRRRAVRAAAMSERGQASVELVALLPLLVAVALAAGQLLAFGAAREAAGQAAGAGAIALLRGGDAAAAARAAVPGWSRERVAVRVRGRQVRVRLRPVVLVPGVGDLLVARAAADAGPAR